MTCGCSSTVIPTPGSVSFNTAERIIRMALKNAGLIQEGQDPSGEQWADCLVRLNDLINLWQTQGIKLWVNRLMQLQLQAGVSMYLLGPGSLVQTTREMRVLEGYYVYPNGVSYPLQPLSWNTYNTLSNQNQQGVINSYFVNKQQLSTIITLWLVPDAVAARGTCRFIVQDPIANLLTLTQEVAFPQEWYMALHWGLADDICTGQPDSIVQRCAQRALAFRTALEDWDVEDAPTSFAPDTQRQQGSNFR